jgi:hypothetical protein
VYGQAERNAASNGRVIIRSEDGLTKALKEFADVKLPIPILARGSSITIPLSLNDIRGGLVRSSNAGTSAIASARQKFIDFRKANSLGAFDGAVLGNVDVAAGALFGAANIVASAPNAIANPVDTLIAPLAAIDTHVFRSSATPAELTREAITALSNTSAVELRLGVGALLPEVVAARVGIGRSIATPNLKAPVGLSSSEFSSVSRVLRRELSDVSDDIVIQGSRASGRAGTFSDLDIAVKVSPERFDKIVEDRFTGNIPKSRLDRLGPAVKDGRIFARDAGIVQVRNKVAKVLNISNKLAKQQIQITIVKKGGNFDNGTQIPIER